MKSVLLALFVSALGTVAHAIPIVFSITGSSAERNFTAQLTVDTSVPDGNPGNAALGSYMQTTASLVQFSDGLTLTNQPFEYSVASSYYNSNVNVTYDALSFYFYSPTMFGIELRFTPGTFANDAAITPFYSSLTPDVVDYLGPTDWFILKNGRVAFGTVDSVSVAAANVPDSGTTAGLLLLPLTALAALVRQRRRKIA